MNFINITLIIEYLIFMTCFETGVMDYILDLDVIPGTRVRFIKGDSEKKPKNRNNSNSTSFVSNILKP